jgi:translocation protein SEC62
MQGQPHPGQMPSPEQIAAMQRQIAADAEKAGMTVPQFIEHLKKQAMEQQARMQQQQQQQGPGHPHPHQHQHQHQQQQGVAQPIVPGPPNPVALTLAKFLRSQDLKPRTVILNGERKDMFRGEQAPPVADSALSSVSCPLTQLHSQTSLAIHAVARI